MKTKGGTKVRDIVERVDTCNRNVIIVDAGTCDITTTTPEELRVEIITSLKATKVKNHQSQVAFSSIL